MLFISKIFIWCKYVSFATITNRTFAYLYFCILYLHICICILYFSQIFVTTVPLSFVVSAATKILRLNWSFTYGGFPITYSSLDKHLMSSLWLNSLSPFESSFSFSNTQWDFTKTTFFLYFRKEKYLTLEGWIFFLFCVFILFKQHTESNLSDVILYLHIKPINGHSHVTLFSILFQVISWTLYTVFLS
jgi:hypothetical protein